MKLLTLNVQHDDTLKEIPGYDGKYFATRDGRIFNAIRGVWVRSYIDVSGYQVVTVHPICGKKKNVKVHRLIAITFIPNPDGKPIVDHINTIRTDNRVENLRWVTSSENCNNPLTLAHLGKAKTGVHPSKESREKMRQSHLGKKYPNRIMTDEWRRHVMAANHRKRGSKWSEAMREKMNERFIGEKSPLARKVIQYDKNGGFIKCWNCIMDASRELGIYSSAISNCLYGRSKTAGGFIWKLNDSKY